MKTIYLHVGNFKTGTSAIQKYCSDNRASLLAEGYDYVKAGRERLSPTNHSQLSLSLFKKLGGRAPEWYTSSASFADVSRQVQKAIEDSPCDNIVISSEEFYRLADLGEKRVNTAKNDLSALLGKYNVKVIMYVREPFPVVKSWYNQVNKADRPRPRFIDLFSTMEMAILLPRANAEFWRSTFGPDCLHLEPYQLKGSDHIDRFFQLLGSDMSTNLGGSNFSVNTKLNENSLELERIEKILAIKEPGKRAWFLRNNVFQSEKNFEALTRRIDYVNADFSTFSSEESLPFDQSNFSLADLLIHEEKVNSKEVINMYVGGSYSSGQFWRSLRRPFKQFLRSIRK